MPKKSKKSKKRKTKDKKHKKHKRKYSSSEESSTSSSGRRSSSSSSSDSDSSNEYEWVEKAASKDTKIDKKRDDWMMCDSFVPTYSLNDKKKERQDQKEHAEKESILDNPGQSVRELNPYWKNGGTGLPPEKSESRRHSRTEVENFTNSKRRSPDYDDYFRAKTSKGFMKPDDNKRDYNTFGSRSSSNATSRSGWRKTTGNKSENVSQKVEKRRSPSPLPRSSHVAEVTEQRTTEETVTDEEMNLLASKILKAEIMGNKKLVDELTAKLERARKSRDQKLENAPENVVLLTNVNARGFTQPVRNTSDPKKGQEKRKKTYDTHLDGKRVRYFEDDEKYSLKEMFEKEQMLSAADHNLEFARLSGKSKGNKDYDIDDLFMEQSTSNRKKADHDMERAVEKQKRTEKALDNCTWCLTNNKLKKHLIISRKSSCYLSVPYFQSLTENHCMIVPSYHSTCATLLDEDVWEEILDYCKALVKIFRARDQDAIFFETAMYFKNYPHMILHCVPIPYESGNLAPIYFKKAILECEKEWAINKKLVEYKKMDVRRAVPKGLPYFMVNFGLDSGFAHVIEDEQYFPKNFAQEIIGGMLDLDHRLWRKHHADDFETQCKKVNKFKKIWEAVTSDSD